MREELKEKTREEGEYVAEEREGEVEEEERGRK